MTEQNPQGVAGEHEEGDTVTSESGVTHGAHNYDSIRKMIEHGSISHAAYIDDYVETGELTPEQAYELKGVFRDQYGGDMLDRSKTKPRDL